MRPEMLLEWIPALCRDRVGLEIFSSLMHLHTRNSRTKTRPMYEVLNATSAEETTLADIVSMMRRIVVI